MGLWEWLIGSVLGRPNPAAPRESVRSSGTTSARTPGTPTGRRTIPAPSAAAPATSEGAVAVLDDPRPGCGGEPEPEHDLDEPPWWAPEGQAPVEFLPPRRPELSGNARTVENLLISHFDGHDLTMPALPQAAERVLGALGRKDCNFIQVADEIADDQVLAAALLRAVNSPFYRGIEKISSIRQSVTRLGAKALRALIMHQALRAATFMKQGGDNALAMFVWKRSLTCGFIMRGLAKFTGKDEESAFLTGLLHDIGSVITLRIVCDEEKQMHERLDLPTFEYLCFESHQEFGELVAKEWKLPAELISIISSHHTTPAADDPQRVERLMIQFTDMVAAMIGPGTPMMYDLRASGPALELGLFQKPGFEAFLGDLPAEIDEATDFF